MGSMGQGPYVRKGDYIEAEWFDTKPVALAGAQFKLGATKHQVAGVVLSIRADRPVNPTEVRFLVKPAEGENVLVNPDHVKRHVGERLPTWPHFEVWREEAIKAGFLKETQSYREDDVPKPPVGTCHVCGAPPGSKCDAGLHS